MNTTLTVLDAVANSLWQAAAVAAAVWLCLRCAPRINAATRCAVWWTTLAAVLILPLGARIVHPPSRSEAYPAVHAPAVHAARHVGYGADYAPPEPVLVRVPAQPESVWPRAAFGLWSAIVLWRLARILQSYFFLRGVKKRARRAGFGLPPIARRAAVLASDEIASPMAVGFLHPAVLVPESLVEALASDERDHVLLHEAAHLAAYDDWSNLLLRILGGVLALHPVAVWILRRIEIEREIACDEWVVARTGAARRYARSLAHLMELRHTGEGPVLASGIFGRRSRLGRRIELLLQGGRTFSGRASRKGMLTGAAGICVLLLAGSLAPRWIALAQEAGTPEWQTAAGGKMEFEVASVKPSPTFRPPLFTLDSGDSFAATRTNEPPRGRFYAVFPLTVYIEFAYKLASFQYRELAAKIPKWASTDNFEIEAKASSPNATKDQMRLMMQSLLAERFHLALHFETRVSPVFALVLAKPGRPGPDLRAHSEGPACDTAPFGPEGPRPVSKDAFPPVCDVYMAINGQNGTQRFGSRDTTMDLLAEMLPSVDRAVVNRTGLTGRFDFVLEYAKEQNSALPPGPDAPPAEPPAAPFLDALREQLGLKLEPTKAPIQVPVVDRVERPSPN